MKTTLISILWRKEMIHWNRIGKMFSRFSGWLNKATFGLIVVIGICIFHYLFALMHTAYEIFLFIFARQAFRSNLHKMDITTVIPVKVKQK
jgi:hypothetical protein